MNSPMVTSTCQFSTALEQFKIGGCANAAGQMILCPDQLEESYSYYKESFMGGLTKLLNLFKDYTADEGDFSEHLKIDTFSENIPKKMPLGYAFRLNNGTLYPAGHEEYKFVGGCEKISQVAKKIIEGWHPGKEIAIENCEISAGEEKSYRSHVFHIDQRIRGFMNLPANESPMIKGDIWLTQKDERVKLHTVSKRDRKIVVSDLKYNGRRKVSLEDLSRPEKYTERTTQIIPGLALDDGASFNEERVFSIPESDLESILVMEHYKILPADRSRVKNLQSIVQLLNKSSVAMPKGPYLIPVSKLMHGFPIGDYTNKSPIPKSLDEFMEGPQEKSPSYDRWLLTVNYKVG